MLPFSTALSKSNQATIGGRLAAKRVLLRLSQETLGGILGIAQNKVSKIERGKEEPDERLLAKINEFIGDMEVNHYEPPIVSICLDAIQDRPEIPAKARIAPAVRANGKAVAETPIEAATRLHTEFLELIDAQGDGSNRLDIAAERVQEALWWFLHHFNGKQP
jgi:transcriptional regulator with XRE-family HTH domain